MKGKEPKYDLRAHLNRFSTEEQCYDHIILEKWKGEPVCPKCGNAHGNKRIKNRRDFRCSITKCRKQFSPTKGTIFENSKIPLTKWFEVIFLFITHKGGLSSYQLSALVGIKQSTVWFMLKRIRFALNKENDITLSGVVEVDETVIAPSVVRDKRLEYFKDIHDAYQEFTLGPNPKKRRKKGDTKKATGRPRGSTKAVMEEKRKEAGISKILGRKQYKEESVPFEHGAVIFGMVERGGRAVFKKIGRDRRSINADSIYPILEKHVSKDSILATDQLNIYDEIGGAFQQHQKVNHRFRYVSKQGYHNNSMENAWKHLKKVIRATYAHVSYWHIDGYLNEYAFRWNRRKQPRKVLFEDFMPMGLNTRLSYRELMEKTADEYQNR